eukprot:c31496_g1_i1 orf=4-180(-)
MLYGQPRTSTILQPSELASYIQSIKIMGLQYSPEQSLSQLTSLPGGVCSNWGGEDNII